jgi:hypothetical protein
MNEEDISQSQMTNGFLKCIANGTELHFEFEPVNEIAMGGKRKTRKQKRRNKRTRKNKKLKHKW